MTSPVAWWEAGDPPPTAATFVLSMLKKRTPSAIPFAELERELDDSGMLPFGVDPIDVITFLRRDGLVVVTQNGDEIALAEETIPR